MSLFSLILIILQIFLKLPDIWKTIKEIMELIKLMKGEEKKAAQNELKAVLMRYKNTKKGDKQQVSEKGGQLAKELEALKAKLKAKVS